MQNERIIELAQKVRDMRALEDRRIQAYEAAEQAQETAHTDMLSAAEARREAERELHQAINTLPVAE